MVPAVVIPIVLAGLVIAVIVGLGIWKVKTTL